MSIASDNPVPNLDTKIRISKNELVDLGNFKPEDVDLESISRSLNQLKRFCDHISLRIEQNMLFGTFPPEDYVQEFMQKYDTKKMFEECAKFEIDLVSMYKTYKQ